MESKLKVQTQCSIPVGKSADSVRTFFNKNNNSMLSFVPENESII